LDMITEHLPFCSHCKGQTLLSRKTASFVILDDGLDVSGQVREHGIVHSYLLYHRKGHQADLFNTTACGNISQNPSTRQVTDIKNPFSIRVKASMGMRLMRRFKKKW